MNIYLFIFYSGLFILIYSIVRHIKRKFNLKNQNCINSNTVVCITGGCSGIGKQIIKILINDYKCQVVNIDIQEQLFEKHENIYNYKCDLADSINLENTLDDIFTKFNKIDILINNAGISYNRNFKDLNINEFVQTVEVNYLAPIKICKLFLNKFKDSQFHLVTIASVMSHLIADKSPDYISSKSALYSAHECLRYDYYDKTNIKFTVVCPYAVDTGMFPGFVSPLPFINILECSEVSRQIVNSIILKDKIVFIPFYMEYICYIFKFIPVYFRDLIYFRISKK